MKHSIKTDDLLAILSQSFKNENQNYLKNFVEQWKLKRNSGLSFPRLLAINSLLFQLPRYQIDIIKNKFKYIADYYQMLDIIAELYVASKYVEDKPLFIQEIKKVRTPDLYLKKTNKYIEVKVINSSDYSHDFEDIISKNSAHMIATTGTVKFLSEDEAKDSILPKLTKKAKEKIDCGKDQLKCKDGFIYLLYNIDKVTDKLGGDSRGYFYDLPKFLGNELDKFITQYSIETNITVVSEAYILNHFPNP